MTRKEELQRTANNYGLNIRKGYPRVMDETDKFIYNAFIAGAEFEHERIINKLKKYLEKYL